MGELTIRPATLEDAPAIATVHVRTWQSAYRGQIPDAFLDSMSVEVRIGRWQRILTNQGTQERTFVALLGGNVVGFCSVGRSRDEDADDNIGELYAIYTDAQAMNHGIGSALIQAGQEYFIEQNFSSATLWVLASNHRARRFYESKGWAADGLTKQEEIGNALLSEMRYTIHW